MNVEIFLEEITYNNAAPLLQKYKQDECDYENIPFFMHEAMRLK